MWPAGPLDVIVVAAVVWLSALVRLSASLVRGEASSREIDVVWLVVFLAPVVIWKEWRSRGAQR